MSYSPRWWRDITQDPRTHHVVAKDLYKAISFFAGLFYLLVLVPAVVMLTSNRLVLPLESGMALVTLAFGLQTLKEVASFFNRRTKDAKGYPLVEPGPPNQPLMPQVDSPSPSPPPHER